MLDTIYTVEFQGITYDASHGSPFDRGSADSYYGRRTYPHKGGVGGDSGPRIDTLTEAERTDYLAGYAYNEESGERKQYD